MNNPRALRCGRAALVQHYQEHPSSWPDGIESRANRWYTSHKPYWDAMAKKVKGSHHRPEWIDPLDDPIANAHLHSDGYPEDDVPRRLDVTINRPVTKKPVTKIRDVTEIAEVLAKRGRPKSGKATTGAERMRQLRAKQKAK